VSEIKMMQKALQGSKTTISELIHICNLLSQTITPKNFTETEHSSNSDDIFTDSVAIRTIESWVSKIAYDYYDNKRGKDRAFKVCEVIDLKIREFATAREHMVLIETFLKRKLTSADVVRLLWVGDQGCLFTKQFMSHFIPYLQQHGLQKAIDLTACDTD
jgi:hypothetical protein